MFNEKRVLELQPSIDQILDELITYNPERMPRLFYNPKMRQIELWALVPNGYGHFDDRLVTAWTIKEVNPDCLIDSCCLASDHIGGHIDRQGRPIE